MKKLLIAFMLIGCCFMNGTACTNLIVGKKASADGSVMCTYCCDGAGWIGGMMYFPAGYHAKGEKLPVHTWRTGPIRGYIDQVEHTNGVIGYINDKQVCIVETTLDGRKELQNKEGMMHYGNLIMLGLQRANSAREAIKVMTDLANEHGYCSTCENFTICDKNEAWVMEMIGKGPGVKGAVWVAIRIPDDCIYASANISRIRQFPLNDKENCLYAKDVISFAREKGYFQGKDKDFSFREAYCPFDAQKVRYTDTRVWSFFRHHTNKAEMDKYIPYLKGQFDKYDHLPLYIKPDKPITLQELKNDMRDHYEGTIFDMTTDIAAGPYGSPARPIQSSFTGKDGGTYIYERSIATQRSEFTLVAQLRSWLPNDIGGVMYYTCDDASMTAYVPIYCSCTRIPDAFNRSKIKYEEFDEKNAFWMCNWVSNMVYPRYSVMMPDVKDAQKELEDYYTEDQKTVEAEVSKLVSTDRSEYLTSKSEAYTQKMMDRWGKLARFLIVKHNDMIVVPSENGEIQFSSGKKTQKPTYNPAYNEEIIKLTGDKYRVK